ncbi:hypothetical protein AB1N83_003237 [Pleurotus pulmonarius]
MSSCLTNAYRLAKLWSPLSCLSILLTAVLSPSFACNIPKLISRPGKGKSRLLKKVQSKVLAPTNAISRSFSTTLVEGSLTPSKKCLSFNADLRAWSPSVMHSVLIDKTDDVGTRERSERRIPGPRAAESQYRN